MEEVILGNLKERGELFVVLGHQLCLWRRDVRVLLAALVRDLENVVDILDSAEAFRVQV